MELLERYLVQVEKYLPRKDKEDVSNELRSLILDQLEASESSDQEALEEILKEFGSPYMVAKRYTGDKPLLLPEFEGIMILLFKIIAISIPSAILFAKVIDLFFNETTLAVHEILFEILKVVPNMINGVVLSIGLIFLIFMGISQKVTTVDPETFSPKTLPPVPNDIYKASIVEAVFGITFGIIFLYLINYQQGVFAIYYDGIREPVLNDNFSLILPFLNISVGLSIIIHVIHLIMHSKNKASIIMESLIGIYGAIVLILLASSDIFNDVIVNGYNLGILPTMFRVGLYIGAVAAIIGSIILGVKVFFAKEKR